MGDRDRRLRSVLAILSLLAVCGCVEDSEEEKPPDIGNVPVITDPSQISLPLDAYVMTVEEDVMLERAVWLLTVECLADFGVQYTPPPVQPTMQISYQRRYGLLDLESARAWGYHGGDPAIDREVAEADAAELTRRDSGLVGELLFGPSDAATELPPGVPEDGCLNEARRTLTRGDESYDENVLFSLTYQSSVLAEQDERVQAAFVRWSECMADAGFSYAGPWDANNDQWMEDAVTDRERTVATADVTCKYQTNIVGIWTAVDAAYQERLIDEHAELLTTLTEARTRVLARAASIVAGSGKE